MADKKKNDETTEETPETVEETPVAGGEITISDRIRIVFALEPAD